MGTEAYASTAADALLGEKRELRLDCLRLGIAAPAAAQWAAFQKHGRSYAGPIMDTVALYIEDEPFGLGTWYA
jgi:glutamate/tyrosine decarboxylase-like PLP-dependent enzyme